MFLYVAVLFVNPAAKWTVFKHYSSVPVNATRQTELARDTSNHMCNFEWPRRANAEMCYVEVGRVEVWLLLISSCKERMKMSINYRQSHRGLQLISNCPV